MLLLQSQKIVINHINLFLGFPVKLTIAAESVGLIWGSQRCYVVHSSDERVNYRNDLDTTITINIVEVIIIIIIIIVWAALAAKFYSHATLHCGLTICFHKPTVHYSENAPVCLLLAFRDSALEVFLRIRAIQMYIYLLTYLLTYFILVTDLSQTICFYLDMSRQKQLVCDHDRIMDSGLFMAVAISLIW